MLSVTIQGPVIIEASELAGLIQLVKVPVLVETFEAVTPGPVLLKGNGNGHSVSTPIVHADPPVVHDEPPEPPTPAETSSAPEGKKRHRRTKAEMEAARAAADGQTAAAHTDAGNAASSTHTEPAQATGVTGEAVATGASFDVLRDRFAGLIDKDYDEALNLLQKFGVDRFGALPEKDFAGFAAELDTFGV